MNGTPYSDYAIDNKFMLDNSTFIAKKSALAKFNFAFIYENFKFGVWFDYANNLIYVSNDYIKDSPLLFSCSLNDHNENTLFVKNARKYQCWKIFFDAYQNR